jgi:hypothetical protein
VTSTSLIESLQHWSCNIKTLRGKKMATPKLEWHLLTNRRVMVKMVSGDMPQFDDAEIQINRPPTASATETSFLGGAAAHTSAPQGETLIEAVKRYKWAEGPDARTFCNLMIVTLFVAPTSRVEYACSESMVVDEEKR